MLIRWHTREPEKSGPSVTKITLDSNYKYANVELRARLDEFVTFLEDKQVVLPQTFTELCYRFKDMYGEYPKFLSPTAVFVRVATIEELRKQVRTGWTWDRIIPYDAGPDCRGRPAHIWTPHKYDGTQNFRLGKRDPSHNWGITQINQIVHQTLTTISERYACCGKELGHPGCWIAPAGSPMGQLVPYDLAPNFGRDVWALVKNEDWNAVEMLWDEEPRVGTMWLYEKQHKEWDRRIRKGKATLKDAIINALDAERQLREVDPVSPINPMDKLDALDKATLNQILELQARYNKAQCGAKDYDLFRVDIGNKVLVNLGPKFILFRSTANTTWAKEIEEIMEVAREIDLTDYANFAADMNRFVVEVSNISENLQKLPQFEPLTRIPVGNKEFRTHVNQVITGVVPYDPSKVPTLDPAILARAIAFTNYRKSNLMGEDVGNYKGIRQSIGYPNIGPNTQAAYDQFIIVRKLIKENAATPLDIAALQEASDRVLERVKKIKQPGMDWAIRKMEELREENLSKWPNNTPPVLDIPEIIGKLSDLFNDGTLVDFQAAIETLREQFTEIDRLYRAAVLELETIKQEGILFLEQNREELQKPRPDVDTDVFNKLKKTIETQTKTEDARELVDEVKNFVGRILRIPTNEPQFMIDEVREWEADWPVDIPIDLRFAQFYASPTQELYDALKTRYRFVVDDAIQAFRIEADRLAKDVSGRSRGIGKLSEFDAAYNSLFEATKWKDARDLMGAMKLLAADIRDTIPTDEQISLFIQMVQDEPMLPIVYSKIVDEANDTVETKDDLQNLRELFIQQKIWTRDMKYELTQLIQAGYEDSDLTKLNDIVYNRPRAESDLDDFKAAKAFLPALFPLAPNMKRPKSITYFNMVRFFKSIPRTPLPLDSTLKLYKDKLLFKKLGDIDNFEDYTKCWKAFIEALLLFPGKRIDDLNCFLMTDNCGDDISPNYQQVYDAIAKLKRLECLLIEPKRPIFEEFPEEDNVWIFNDLALLRAKDPNFQEIVETFNIQVQEEKYSGYLRFMAFAKRLRESKYSQKYLRVLKQEAPGCNAAILEMLNKMEGMKLDDIEENFNFDDVEQCLTILERTWTFAWDIQPIVDVYRTLDEGQLISVRNLLSAERAKLDQYPNLMKFIILLTDTTNPECLRSLVEFLKTSNGKDLTIVERLVLTDPSVIRAKECVSYGYGDVISALEEDPIDFVKLEETVNAIVTEPERQNAIELLNRLGGGLVKKEEE